MGMSTPKILAFAGSTRSASYNKQLVRFAADAARVAGAEVTLLDLRDYPLPLFDGDKAALTAALKAADRKVTQSGYPVDHLDALYTHTDCVVTGWAQTSVLSHQCDTLPGDSGSPLMLKTDNGWQLIGVQSSAPAAKDRWRADNRALSVTGFRDKLEALAQE